MYALAEPEKSAVVGDNLFGDLLIWQFVPDIFVEAAAEDQGGVAGEDELESIVDGVAEVLGFEMDEDAPGGVHGGVVEEGQ